MDNCPKMTVDQKPKRKKRRTRAKNNTPQNQPHNPVKPTALLPHSHIGRQLRLILQSMDRPEQGNVQILSTSRQTRRTHSVSGRHTHNPAPQARASEADTIKIEQLALPPSTRVNSSTMAAELASRCSQSCTVNFGGAAPP